MARYDPVLHWLFLLLALIGLVEIFSAYTVPRVVYYSVYEPGNVGLIIKSFKPLFLTILVYSLGFGIYLYLIRGKIEQISKLLTGKNILLLTWFTLLLMIVVVIEKFIFHLHANRWLIGPKHMVLITGLTILSAFLFLAYQFSKENVDPVKVGFYFSLFEVLLFLQPDTGTLLLLLFALFTLIYFKTDKVWLKRLYIFSTLALFFAGLIAVLTSKMSIQLPNIFKGTLLSHVIVRINNWLNPFSDVTAKSYQIANSLYAVHKGGFSGVGYGFGMRKLYMGPTVHTDFIFATIGEEMGFIFALFLFAITLLLLLRFLNIAYRFKGRFERNFTILVAIETFAMSLINAGMAVNLLPSKGWPYPLISYAPFFVLFYIVQIGIVQFFVRKRFYEVF